MALLVPQLHFTNLYGQKRGNDYMNAWDFIVHNLDYEEIQELYDTELIKFGSQALQEDLK